MKPLTLARSIREHYPSWLSRGLTRTGAKVITDHSVESQHHVRMSEAIRSIYTITGVRSKQIKHRLLSTAEAIAIPLNQSLIVRSRKVSQSSGFTMALNRHEAGYQLSVKSSIYLIHFTLQIAFAD
ncbi:unnamed protein product [Echinostoma caproni]|uniref:Transposase n=1 Tax=Echinostoma caproni TaxID=27848 RepID=A0A183AF35_9TREM|nr:unnamed protein product [Echinostoma caproni]